MSNTNIPKQGGQGGPQRGGGKWAGPRRQLSNAGMRMVAKKASSSSSHGGGLEGQFIDCGQPKHTDLYNTTMEGIVNHVRIEFKDSELVVQTIAMGVKIELPKLEKLPEADETDIEIWQAEIKDFV